MQQLPTTVTQARPARRRWVVLAAGAVALLCAAGLATVWLIRSPPPYWPPLDGSDPAIAALAERVEAAVASQTTAVRPAEELWALELTQEQINAWLAARLPLWLANQGVDRQVVEAVRRAMVQISSRQVELAAELRFQGSAQIVRLVYRPMIVENQPVRLQLHAAYLGRLRVPMHLLVERVAGGMAGAEAHEVAEVIATLRSIEVQSPVDDHRWVAAMGVELSDGRAVLTCRTVRRDPTP